MRPGALALTIALLAPGLPAAAADFRAAAVRDYVEARILPWIETPSILTLLKDKNRAHAGLQPADISALDMVWRDERDSGRHHLITSVLTDPVSLFLQQKTQSSAGVITEIIVMDRHGLNVASSGVPSDYWQGDEAKFQRSFEAGANAVFIDEPERDESTQLLQVQASMTITDESGAPVGAITVGLNLDYL